MHHIANRTKTLAPHRSGLLVPAEALSRRPMVVDGGVNPSGDVCAGQHWHGFIGMEKEAIDTSSAWMKNPGNGP